MNAWTKAMINFFTSNSGASMASLETLTKPKINKTNGLKGENKKTFQDVFGNKTIYKRAIRFVGIGHKYNKTIQNRLDKEETETTYKPEPRTWGERIGSTVLFNHKENIYLEYFYTNANSHKSTFQYVWDDGTQLTEGETKKAKDLFKLDPQKTISKKQESLGLTEKTKIIVNCIKIENVLSVKAFGHRLTKENIQAEISI
jgi:hypothetical protein